MESVLLTVLLSSPDADRVDSTTLFGKADLGFASLFFAYMFQCFPALTSKIIDVFLTLNT